MLRRLEPHQSPSWSLATNCDILFIVFILLHSYINKSIYSCCSFCVLNIYDLTSKTIVRKRNIDSPPSQYFQHLHREALPSGHERKEGNINELQINPQRSYSAEFDGPPSYDEYDFDGKSSGAELQ